MYFKEISEYLLFTDRRFNFKILYLLYPSHPTWIVIGKESDRASAKSQGTFLGLYLIKKGKQTFVFYEHTKAKFILKTFDARTFRCEPGKRKYSQCFLPGPFSGGQGFFSFSPMPGNVKQMVHFVEVMAYLDTRAYVSICSS